MTVDWKAKMEEALGQYLAESNASESLRKQLATMKNDRADAVSQQNAARLQRVEKYIECALCAPDRSVNEFNPDSCTSSLQEGRDVILGRALQVLESIPRPIPFQ